MSDQPTWPALFSRLMANEDLSTADTEWAIGQIFDGEATPAQIGAFAVALRAKGETVAELAGLAGGALARATPLALPGRIVDVVGTGGDKSGTVNISSMAAVVTAGAGIGVAKHGNRAVSSASGSSDVLDALGVRLDVAAERLPEVFAEAGITFVFAPLFHAGFRFAGPVRAELGVPTAFNILGPLVNPARPAASLVGVADARIAPLVAGVFAERGDDAWIVRGDDGLDEITVTTTSTVWRPVDGAVVAETLDPQDVGVDIAPLRSLVGGDPAHNADVFRRVLDGEDGAIRDAVIVNAGAAIAVHEAGSGSLVERLAAGMERARESLDSGSAKAVLARWVEATQRLAG
ncbi:MAG TPA: anthranilate phosphoribosyltransferase [Aeromicrobium sp.]|nr:anthranilate phosphoribosyltransferase [Aeromicrobium sp.]